MGKTISSKSDLKVGETVYCKSIANKEKGVEAYDFDPIYGTITAPADIEDCFFKVKAIMILGNSHLEKDILKRNDLSYYDFEMRRLTPEERKSLIAEVL